MGVVYVPCTAALTLLLKQGRRRYEHDSKLRAQEQRELLEASSGGHGIVAGDEGSGLEPRMAGEKGGGGT